MERLNDSANRLAKMEKRKGIAPLNARLKALNARLKAVFWIQFVNSVITGLKMHDVCIYLWKVSSLSYFCNSSTVIYWCVNSRFVNQFLWIPNLIMQPPFDEIHALLQQPLRSSTHQPSAMKLSSKTSSKHPSTDSSLSHAYWVSCFIPCLS